MKRYKLSTIADFNASALSAKTVMPIIQYLDTSSITENSIEGFQTLSRSDAPSRAKRRVKDSTIIYSTVRPRLKHFGILNHPDENLIVSTGFVTIDIKDEYIEEIDPYYLYCLLTRNEITDYLGTIADTAVTSYPSINPSDIEELEFDFPGIKEQRASSSILRSIDDKIAINSNIRKRLEQTAREYYDFYINNIRIPKDSWRIVSLCEVIERKISGDWGDEEISGTKSLRVSCVRGADMNDLTQLPTRYIKMKEDPLLDDGDIVVEISGGSPTQSTGRSVLITEEVLNRFNNKVICSNFCRALRFKKPLHGYFYYLVFKSLYETGRFFNYEGKTSGLHNLDIDAFLENKVCIPSDEELTLYSQEIKGLYSQISVLVTENLQLMKEREYILPLLISSQLLINE